MINAQSKYDWRNPQKTDSEFIVCWTLGIISMLACGFSKSQEINAKKRSSDLYKQAFFELSLQIPTA